LPRDQGRVIVDEQQMRHSRSQPMQFGESAARAIVGREDRHV
jgi:hypothetical protein